ncbi:MAG TPA: hypothetical protein HPP79_10305 [Gammaproteobacteria bacterium]|jgi:hypothetical protein|nr:hypothetical protein [Candidatus Neomarinimicrobiota bacterium]HIJ26055.1 hypothetical protein [Gammaproteobacteria bacterium]HIJ48181.1 hypothetical protein [Gammaproteobacteria bacterium]
MKNKKLDPIIKKLDALIGVLDSPDGKETWTLTDISMYTGVCMRSCRERMVHRDGFPAGMKPLGEKGAHRIWMSGEVKQWLRRQTA